jgi:hypothetical protein
LSILPVLSGSLTISGLDGRLALALFVPGTVVGSIVVEGNQWLERSDYDLGSRPIKRAELVPAGGIEPTA